MMTYGCSHSVQSNGRDRLRRISCCMTQHFSSQPPFYPILTVSFAPAPSPPRRLLRNFPSAISATAARTAHGRRRRSQKKGASVPHRTSFSAKLRTRPSQRNLPRSTLPFFGRCVPLLTQPSRQLGVAVKCVNWPLVGSVVDCSAVAQGQFFAPRTRARDYHCHFRHHCRRRRHESLQDKVTATTAAAAAFYGATTSSRTHKRTFARRPRRPFSHFQGAFPQ